jgi:fatty-acid desaturase
MNLRSIDEDSALAKKVFVGKHFLWMLALHILAIGVAPFYFRWDAFLWGWTFVFIQAYSMGIFHHMMLTHDSFQSKRWVKLTGALLGTLSWRGPFSGPLQYVAMHRVHHEYSDTPKDPHTPTDGLFHAFIGWFWRMSPVFLDEKRYLKYVPERLTQDKGLLWIDRNVHFLQFLWGLLSILVGLALNWSAPSSEKLAIAWSFLLYGVCVKSVLVIWMADTVDLINHTIGYRNVETKDQSTNSFIMAAVHLGGAISWHNNHHAHPDYFSVKLRWWEFDVHHAFLRLLQRMGLVWEIRFLESRPSN